MAVATLPRIVFNDDGPSPRVTWAMGLSLALHGILLAVLVSVRLMPVERPEGSIEVSLVSLQMPRPSLNPKPVANPPVERPPTPPAQVAPAPKPVAIPSPVRSEPVQKVVPAPVPAVPAVVPSAPPAAPPPAPKATAPRVAPVIAAPPLRPSPATKKESERLVNDALKQIELPPDVPRLGDISPPTPAAPQRPVQNHKTDPVAPKLSNRIRDLRVPDASASSPPVKSASGPLQSSPPRPIISEDILEKLQRPVEQIQKLPEQRPAELKEARVASAQPAASHADPVASADLTPATTIQAAGAGTNRYWALVQQKINSRWIAPPVDLTQRYFQVIIRFTMDRTGRVIDVVVERSSGNDYYDNAGRRAVLAADPLPPFPPEMKDRQLSPLIYFSVGEQAG